MERVDPINQNKPVSERQKNEQKSHFDGLNTTENSLYTFLLSSKLEKKTCLYF